MLKITFAKSINSEKSNILDKVDKIETTISFKTRKKFGEFEEVGVVTIFKSKLNISEPPFAIVNKNMKEI